MLVIARLVVVLSTVGAVAAHAWLSPDASALRWATPTALLLGALSGWVWSRGAQTVIFALAHVWPLIVFMASGTSDPNALVTWVALLVGRAIVSAPFDRWSLPDSWRIPVAAWGLVLAFGWPIVLWRELDFSLVPYAQHDVLSGLWAGAPRQTAALLTAATLSQLSALLVIDWLWARYGRADVARFVQDVVWPMTAGTAIAIGVGVYQGLVDLDWLNLGVWPRLGRATGTFFDANAFGAVAALWGSLAAGAMLAGGKRWLTRAGIGLLLLSGVAVWVSGSRTALAGWFIVVVGIAGTLVGARRVPYRVIAGGLTALALLLAVGVQFGGQGTAIYRFWRTLPTPTAQGISTFAREMWDRNGYGVAAVRIIQDYPVTGIGPGAFQLFAPDYAYLTMRRVIPPDNAQNWWREQLAELGVLGALPPLVCSLLVGATVVALLRRRSADPLALLVGASIAALGCMAMVGPPTPHPIVMQTTAVMLFWASRLAFPYRLLSPGSRLPSPDCQLPSPDSRLPTADSRLPSAVCRLPSADCQLPSAVCRPPSPVCKRRRAATVLVFVGVLPLVWTGLTLRTAIAELRPPFRAQRIGWVYGYGFTAAEPVPAGERRWATYRAVGVIPAAGERLVLTLEPPGEASAARPVHVRVRDRHRAVLDAERAAPDPITCVVERAPGQRWVMVQIDTDGPLTVADGFARALRVTARWE